MNSPCIEHLGANRYRCRNMGWTFETTVLPIRCGCGIRETPPRQSSPSEAQQPGWGDRLEKALRTVGITKDRVERWLGRPCGCAKRRERLNRLGRWVERVLKRQGKIAD